MVAMFQQIGRDILGATQQVGDSKHQTFVPIPAAYTLFESYYMNRMYQRSGVYADHRTGLPVTIRPIHNPTARVVDWYAGHVAPGSMSNDGLPVNGQPNRIAFDSQTPEQVRLAVQQAFLWGAAGFDIGLYVRTGAMLGDVFAEVVSDPERQKVYPKLVHPRYVTNVEWNDTGDVTAYTIQIPQVDGNGRSYTWGKTVTKDTITTLKDGKPFGYNGNPQTVPNLWGFVPAVWVQHRNIGGQHGAPAFAHVIGKIDELNGLVSEIDDYILKFTKQSVMIATNNVKAFNEAVERARTRRRLTIRDSITADDMTARRDGINIMAAEPPLASVRMLENIGLADAVPHRDRLAEEIEKDLSEITLSDKLLEMSQVTAPGAIPLVQDVKHLLDEAAANYDAGLIKLGQMAVSMAAQAIADGVWDRRSMTSAQERFAPFNVNAYDRGELAFSISARSLVPDSMDVLIARSAGLERLTTHDGLVRAGLDEAEATNMLAQSREAAAYAADISARTFSAGSIL